MCKNEYRNRANRDVIEMANDVDYFEHDEVTTGDPLYQIEDIFNCLSEFDEIHQTAFLLKYREGLSIDEISSILELSVGTIKSRLFYTRKKIQKKLQQSSHLSSEYVSSSDCLRPTNKYRETNSTDKKI
jgi:RNA polymerase sigma-70 factor (ECF subfamily)